MNADNGLCAANVQVCLFDEAVSACKRALHRPDRVGSVYHNLAIAYVRRLGWFPRSLGRGSEQSDP